MNRRKFAVAPVLSLLLLGGVVLASNAVHLEDPRMYVATCQAYPPSRDWMAAWMSPLEAATGGWSAGDNVRRVLERRFGVDRMSLSLSVAVDHRKPVVDMPKPGAPSTPSGTLLVTKLRDGKHSEFEDPAHTLDLVKPGEKFYEHIDFDPDRYEHFQCPFHVVKPIDDCVTDYPDAMQVDVEVGECHPDTGAPIECLGDFATPGSCQKALSRPPAKDTVQHVAWLRAHGWIDAPTR